MLVYPMSPPTSFLELNDGGQYSDTYRCIQDYPDARVLTDYLYSSNDMTIEICQNSCGAVPYTYVGLENGRDCYCGNEFNGEPKNLPLTECNLPCMGNEDETCGGGSKMQVYTLNELQTGNCILKILVLLC